MSKEAGGEARAGADAGEGASLAADGAPAMIEIHDPSTGVTILVLVPHTALGGYAPDGATPARLKPHR